MSSLTITLIQTNLHWEDKKANLDMLSKKIESIKEKTEIIILPEMFSTGFSMKPELLAEDMNGETVQWMKKIAAEKKVILTGSVMIKDPSIPIATGLRVTIIISTALSGCYPMANMAFMIKDICLLTVTNTRILVQAVKD